jgi:hypothetical protein
MPLANLLWPIGEAKNGRAGGIRACADFADEK